MIYKCPYSDRCPKDIPIDETECCDNEYETCEIFKTYLKDEQIERRIWNWFEG